MKRNGSFSLVIDRKAILIFLVIMLSVGIGVAYPKVRGAVDGIKHESSSLDEKIFTQGINLYFSDVEAMYLIPQKRQIPQQDNIWKAAMNELIVGPAPGSGLTKTIPEGTKILDVFIKGNIAYADFSRELQSNHWGGSTGETHTIYSIVNTLTDFPSIDYVQILIEGQAGETIAGHILLDEPIARDEAIIKCPERKG